MADGKEKSVHVGLVVSSTTKHFHSSATDLLPLPMKKKPLSVRWFEVSGLVLFSFFQDSK